MSPRAGHGGFGGWMLAAAIGGLALIGWINRDVVKVFFESAAQMISTSEMAGGA